MGVSKTELFTFNQNELSLMGKALAHPARVAILEILLKSEKCITGDLVHELGLAQSTISQHLKCLKEVGLIKGNIDGTSVSYCLDVTKWESLKIAFIELFNTTPQKPDNCC